VSEWTAAEKEEFLQERIALILADGGDEFRARYQAGIIWEEYCREQQSLF